MTGKVHSIQSLGTVDGPGVRFVVFLNGCNLRCGCCHNPDTWDINGGKSYTARQIVDKALRCKEYFGRDGGITVSGGEPLLQADFVREIFALCHSEGINTCLDTSGAILTDSVRELLTVTDRILLDIKYTNNEQYEKHVGCSLSATLEFLSYANERMIPVTLRQVIIPTLNDNGENIQELKKIADRHPCVDKIELLPFKKLCQVKYDMLGITFPFADIQEPSADTMSKLNNMIKTP